MTIKIIGVIVSKNGTTAITKIITKTAIEIIKETITSSLVSVGIIIKAIKITVIGGNE